MAPANQLERIGSLSDKLAPLSGKRRGMPIQAEDWNTLVEVLAGILEVDRLQETAGVQALESHFALADHEHVGEVAGDWLTADLRAGFNGGLGIEARRTLAEMDARIQALSADVARLTELVQSQQKLLDQSQVANFDRDKLVRGFEGRLGTVDNLRTLVSGVSSQVDALGKNVDVVLDLRKALTDPQGNPIDVRRMGADLADLQKLRESLKGVDGDLLRLRDFELKIRDLEDAIGTGGGRGLDDRINVAVGAAEIRLAARQDEGGAQIKAELGDALATQLSGVRAQLGAELGQQTNAAIGAAETRLGDRFDAQLADTSQQLRDSILETTQRNLDATRATIETGLTASFTRAIDTRVTDVLGQVDTRIERQVGALSTQLQGDISQQIGGASDALKQSLNDMVRASADQISGTLDRRVQESVAEQVGALDGRIDDAVERGLARMDFDTRITRIVDARISQLPPIGRSQIEPAVSAILAERDTQLTTQFRTELNQAITAEKTRSSSELQQVTGQLRAETTLQQLALLDQTNLRLRSEVSSLRAELNQTINDRIIIRRP